MSTAGEFLPMVWRSRTSVKRPIHANVGSWDLCDWRQLQASRGSARL